MRGLRIIFSRRFWRDFREHWSPGRVARRLDAHAERLRRWPSAADPCDPKGTLDCPE